MKVIELLRVIRKNLLLLILVPALLAGLVTYLTREPSFTYSSETTLYTGIASGTSVDLDKSFSYFANNTAFDNLINVITSRETQRDVALRLLAQHLMLKSPDARYISKASWENLRSITPPYIYKLVANSEEATHEAPVPKLPALPDDNEYVKHTVQENETLYSISRMYGVSLDVLRALNNLTDNTITTGQTLKIELLPTVDTLKTASSDTIAVADTTPAFSFAAVAESGLGTITIPTSVNKDDFEKTVQNLQNYLQSNDTNYIYKLLNFNHPHYSYKALAKISVKRIASSDLVKLAYETTDPGICQQTLALVTEACIKNYRLIKENRTDAIVKYFEHQLKQASEKLKIGEDKLLNFNEDNNIINYYEQSKAVAVVKEDLDVDYNNKRIKLAGLQASIKRIEEKLGAQQQLQLKSAAIIQKRNLLSDINSQIADAEIMGYKEEVTNDDLVTLKQHANQLKDEIRATVSDLYMYGNTIEGLPIGSLLNDWIANVIDYEDTKAGLEVLAERIREFQKQYEIYAPAGANIKRIEREISVSEQEFLEILHGLNLAKLKMQDAELSATIKAVDPPFFPLSPNPTKRKILILVAALFGFVAVMGTILAMEYFDASLKNAKKASKLIGIEVLGIFPKVLLKTGSLNFPFVANRLLELIWQQTGLILSKTQHNKPVQIVFTSSQSNEGKTLLAGNLAVKLKSQGHNVLYLNYSHESLKKFESTQIGYIDEPDFNSSSDFNQKKHSLHLISRLAGYGDPRIDYNSTFLEQPANKLTDKEYIEYEIKPGFENLTSYTDILQSNNLYHSLVSGFVFIELPPLLYYPFPSKLLESAGLTYLICRANRAWTSADRGVLDLLNQSGCKIAGIVNGVDLQAVEASLGDLPKKRTRFRRALKNLVRLQFNTRQHL